MPPSVTRRPGTADAVVLGLAATLGAGVFGVWGPAADAAGAWLPMAVVVAGVVALCVAAAGSDVARAHPGGCAVGGTALLPAGLARLAGLAHLVGRAAAGATAATVFGSYVLPSRPVLAAVGLVVVVTGLAIAGVTWTVRSAWALVGGVGVVLFVAVLVGLAGAGGQADRRVLRGLGGGTGRDPGRSRRRRAPRACSRRRGCCSSPSSASRACSRSGRSSPTRGGPSA